MSSKRQSLAPPAPKPPTTLHASLCIAENASLIGTKRITIGANTVIHPRSKLNSTYGPITIGNYCIVSERCQIGLQADSEEHDQAEGLTIGDGVVVEVGAVVEAKRIGDGCVIEINTRIGKGAVLGKHCKIGPLCTVADGEILPDFTVLYGHNSRRVDRSGAEEQKMKMVMRQVEILRKLIPSNVAKFQ